MASIEKRGKKYRLEIWLGGERKRELFGSRDAAEKQATKLQREYDLNGIVPVAAVGTLGDLIARYERERYPVLRWSDSKSNHLSQLSRDLGNLEIAKLTRPRIVAYGEKLAAPDRKPRGPLGCQGIATRIGFLKDVLCTGRDLEWGSYTPAINAVTEGADALRRLQIMGKGQPRKRRIAREEIATLKAYIEKTPHRGASGPGGSTRTIDLISIMELLSVLPIRVGELCKIKSADIIHNGKDSAVWLRARKHPDHKVKARNDELVPLPVIDGFDTYAMLCAGPTASAPDAAGPFAYDRANVSDAFSQLTDSAGVEDLHLHDFRAHGISFLLNKVQIPTVATISGHKDWKVMYQHYYRPELEDLHADFREAGVGRKVRHLRVAA